MSGIVGPLQPLGYQQLTVSTVAVALTVPAGTRHVFMALDVPANGIRWRDDGTNPTAAIGMPLGASASTVSSLEYEGNAAAFKAIRKDAADAVLNVTYWGSGTAV